MPWPLPVVAPAVRRPGPTVTAISPAFGSTNGGTNVTITGTNFRQDATVTFGGAAAQNVVVRDAQTIVARRRAPPPAPRRSRCTSIGQTRHRTAELHLRSASRLRRHRRRRLRRRPTWPRPRWSPRATCRTSSVLVSQRRRTAARPAVLLVPRVRRQQRVHVRGRPAPAGATGHQPLGPQLEARQHGRPVAGHRRPTSTVREGATMEGRHRVYIFDIIGGHCGSNPSPIWVDQTRGHGQCRRDRALDDGGTQLLDRVRSNPAEPATFGVGGSGFWPPTPRCQPGRPQHGDRPPGTGSLGAGRSRRCAAPAAGLVFLASTGRSSSELACRPVSAPGSAC